MISTGAVGQISPNKAIKNLELESGVNQKVTTLHNYKSGLAEMNVRSPCLNYHFLWGLRK
jgi:hypothetical protein